MALTGLQILQLLPKTNCRECGCNTCLAFAMKLAARKASIAECPYASDDAKETLGKASEPPVRTIELGPDRKRKIGGETVPYRHEKTFVNPTVLAVNVDSMLFKAEQENELEAIRDYTLVRVGETLRIDMIALTHSGGSPREYAEAAARVYEKTQRPLILRSHDPKALTAAAAAVKGTGGILSPATHETAGELVAAARDNGHSLAITAPDPNALCALATRIREGGFSNLLLEPKVHSLAAQFQLYSIMRRAALKDGVTATGYPFLQFIGRCGMQSDTVSAVAGIVKYGGVCVLPEFNPAQVAALMTLRLNIYTDPQKPIQVEPRVYHVGEPKADSAVFVTTNFSLTYFIVSGEIENSGISAWLVIPECEGMSVLTAWAAGKFSGASIAKFVKESGLEKQVTTRQIIIPGYVAGISGELEENLPGWKVIVGPQEASDIESFVKARL